MPSLITGQEIAEHANRDSCWIIVHSESLAFSVIADGPDPSIDKVYDVTDFLDGRDQLVEGK